ncbi:hypothetical protein JOD57_000153 [Geodermatophilus bullaregiensis]|uniref:hypothetical protein n=1 Tax=Geodermatophilus bullaregiensis TaxID=1564160 RepID=UPI00195D229A|nr:hypothetical protein [Geodermatophilus bullaregiensis]MBM7804316.1 hypothetical protein [Geodermatophilus bullaregiensis]
MSPASARESASTSASTSAPAEAASIDELRDALLPAPAFGADATVVGLTLEQVGAGGLPDWSEDWSNGLPDDVTVDPPLCGTALGALSGLPGVGEDGGAAPVLAAQAALGDRVRTVEVLAESPELEGLQLPVDQLLGACSSVTVSGPQGSSTTVDLEALDVARLGDRSAALRVTVSRDEAEAMTALVGVVVTGDRGLLLAQTAAPDAPAPDAAAFTALLGDAAEAAAG